MGRVELLIILVFALVYLTVPIMTLVLVVQINNRLKQIEQYLQINVNVD